MVIEHRGHMVIVQGDFLDWYDEETNTLLENAPIMFENGELIEINGKYMAIEKKYGFVLKILDGFGVEIEDGNNMVIVRGDWLDWYDEETDSLLDAAPIDFENGKLLEINDEYIAIEKKEGFVLKIVDDLGNVEKILYDELMSTKEAAELWGIDESSIRKRIDDFPPGTVRKFGKQWVISRKGMKKIFGKKTHT